MKRTEQRRVLMLEEEIISINSRSLFRLTYHIPLSSDQKSQSTRMVALKILHVRRWRTLFDTT